MYKDLILFFITFLYIFIHPICTETIDDLLPYRGESSDLDQNKNLKLKISLDSVRLKISNNLYLECPVGRLKPATFMFLRKDAVDFISRFSIQLNDTFESIKKRRRGKQAGKLLNSKLNRNDHVKNDEKSEADKLLLHCKWISSDQSQEYGNFTLHLNKPKDNVQLNKYLYKYFDSKQGTNGRDLPKIIPSTNKVLKRKIGERVTFNCRLNQPTDAKITWYRKDDHDFIDLNNEMKTNKHALDISNYQITSNRLTIKEISGSDFAEYVCRASNDYGSDYALYKLEMMSSKQSLEPKIDSFNDVHVKENRSVVLNCSITSYQRFSVQWFKKIDCKANCESKYNFLFIANEEKYRPLLNQNSSLISHNKIQYLATYRLDTSAVLSGQKYICMVRNQNGMNYKIMTLTLSSNVTSGFIEFFDKYDMSTIVYLTSIVIFILLITLILIVVLKRKSGNTDKNELENGNLNNLTTLTRNRSQNEYLNKSNRSKASNEKTLKNSTLLIHNLIQQGRASNLVTMNSVSSQYLNKYNRSKLSSVSTSFHRLNCTPVQYDTLSYLNA